MALGRVSLIARARIARSAGRGRLGESWRILALLRYAPRGLSVALVVLSVLAGLLPVAFLISTSVLLGGLPDAIASGWESEAGSETRMWLIVAAACFVGQSVGAVAQLALGDVVGRRIDGVMRDRVMVASMLGADIATVEDDVNRSLLAEAGRQLQYTFATPGKAAVALVGVLSRYLTLVACAVVISLAFAWWAGVLLVAAAVYVRARTVGKLRRSAPSVNPDWWREGDYFGRTLGLRASVGKELRIFDLAGWVRGRYRHSMGRWTQAQSEVRRRVGYPLPVRETLVMVLAGAAVVVLAARAAATGSLALDDFVFVVMVGIPIMESIGLRDQEFIIVHGLEGLNSLERFERRAAQAPAREQEQERVTVGARPQREIAFEGVGFTYPGHETPVIDGLDLSIAVGSSLAIVGVNGAGKTTLVKLLSGLYEPSAGRICVDGVDLRELDRAGWQRRVAPIFQDFVRYELSAADNVGFGAVQRLGDRAAIRDAAQRAGALEMLERLGSGLDTPLSGRYTGGVDLSGGQWQRVATARALAAVQAQARVLVLDEPTANLDVRSEVAFFEQFLELTSGCTTIVISHRFSTVRRVDRIVVLDGGAIVEDGGHDELLAAGGRYAEMFRLQARRFHEADEPEEAAP